MTIRCLASQGHRVPGLQFYKRMSVYYQQLSQSKEHSRTTGLDTDPSELTSNKLHFLSGTTRTTYYSNKFPFLEKHYTKYTNAKTIKWNVRRHGCNNLFLLLVTDFSFIKFLLFSRTWWEHFQRAKKRKAENTFFMAVERLITNV